MKGEELLEYMSELDPELVEKSKDCGPGLRKEEHVVPITDGKGKVGRKIGWRRIALVAAAVAVFTAACTYGAKQLDLDVELANRLGVRTDEAQKLGDGLVEIGESCTRTVYNEETGVDEDITLTATTSVGDKNSAFIKIETNISVPEGCTQSFDEKGRNYVTFDSIEINQEIKKWDKTGASNALECFVNEDGYLYMIMSVNQAHINKKKLELICKDPIYVCGSDENGQPIKKTLYKGTWNLSWKYCYTSDTATYKVDEHRIVDGIDYHIQKVEVTPLGIDLIGKCNLKSAGPSQDLRILPSVESVTIDGTEYSATDQFSSCEWSDRSGKDLEFTYHCSVMNIGTIIDLSKISKVCVNGEDIDL